jgi:hypothetical protein
MDLSPSLSVDIKSVELELFLKKPNPFYEEDFGLSEELDKLLFNSWNLSSKDKV